jgi:hypothetical protein
MTLDALPEGLAELETLTKGEGPGELGGSALGDLEAFEKGGPYIGPKGGKWADPQHTVSWDEKIHGAGKKQGDLFGGGEGGEAEKKKTTQQQQDQDRAKARTSLANASGNITQHGLAALAHEMAADSLGKTHPEEAAKHKAQAEIHHAKFKELEAARKTKGAGKSVPEKKGPDMRGIGYRHLSDKELRQGVKDKEADRKSAESAGESETAKAYQQIRDFMQEELDRRAEGGGEAASASAAATEATTEADATSRGSGSAKEAAEAHKKASVAHHKAYMAHFVAAGRKDTPTAADHLEQSARHTAQARAHEAKDVQDQAVKTAREASGVADHFSHKAGDSQMGWGPDGEDATPEHRGRMATAHMKASEAHEKAMHLHRLLGDDKTAAGHRAAADRHFKQAQRHIAAAEQGLARNHGTAGDLISSPPRRTVKSVSGLPGLSALAELTKSKPIPLPASGKASSIASMRAAQGVDSEGNAKKGEQIPGGLASGKTPADFPAAALAAGTKVELEHSKDEKVAREIAMDHLTEDPAYYEKLARMESKEKSMATENIGLNGLAQFAGAEPLEKCMKGENSIYGGWGRYGDSLDKQISRAHDWAGGFWARGPAGAVLKAKAFGVAEKIIQLATEWQGKRDALPKLDYKNSTGAQQDAYHEQENALEREFRERLDGVMAEARACDLEKFRMDAEDARRDAGVVSAPAEKSQSAEGPRTHLVKGVDCNHQPQEATAHARAVVRARVDAERNAAVTLGVPGPAPAAEAAQAPVGVAYLAKGGDLVPYASRADQEAAELAKSGAFNHAEPPRFPTTNLVARTCPACGGHLIKALTACPHCNAGHTEQPVITERQERPEPPAYRTTGPLLQPAREVVVDARNGLPLNGDE